MPAALAAWAGAWLGTSGLLSPAALLGAAAAGGLVMAAVGQLRARTPLGPALAVGVLVAVCAATAGHLRVLAVAAGPVDDLAQARAHADLVLRITGDPLPRALPADAPAWQREQVRVAATVTRVEQAGAVVRTDTPVVVLGPPTWGALRPGAVVAASARLGPPSRDGPVVAVLLVRGEPTVLEQRPDPFAAFTPVRHSLREAVQGLPSGPAGLLPSLVTGDESLLSPQLRDDMRDTGLAHLTAVSGANVAIVLGAVLGVARVLGARGWTLPAIGLVAVAGFVLLARPEPSVVRAAAMGVITVLGLVGGARGRGVAPLALAVTLVLLADPWLSRSVGFALSAAATAGIVVLARPWARAAAWMPRPLAAALAVPLAAQLACTPLLVAMTGQLSLSALPANLLAVLAVPPATVLGLAVALVGLVAPAAAHLLAAVAMVPAGWIVLVAERGADLPGTTLPWQAGVPAALALSLLLAVAVPVMLRSRPLSLLLCLLLVVVLVRPGPLRAWPPPGWVVVMCDVGQGDAVVLRAGPGEAVVVDAGPAPGAVDRCLDDLQVRSVPLVVLTHFHADHVGGLEGVSRGRAVHQALVTPLLEPGEQVEAAQSWAQRSGTPLRAASVGDRGWVGAVHWQVLWPARLIRSEGSAPNQASVVLRAEVDGVSVLLTGDVEPAAQRALRSTLDGAALDVDVLKVPHHGSPDQDAELLAATTPRVALVSVGAGNTYGHPDPTLLASLAASGARVARTDHDGDIAVTVGDGLQLVRRGPQSRT